MARRARSSEATRDRILAAAYARLYRAGFARTGMDAIAAAAAVTKRTLYNHYPSKDALVGAVLEAQHGRALAQIADWMDAPAAGAEEMVDGVFLRLAEWASRPRWTGSGFTRIALELADLPGHPARRAAGAHKQAVERRLAQRLGAMGIAAPADLARRIVLLVEGCQVLMLVHRDPAYARAAGAAARALVRAAAAPVSRPSAPGRPPRSPGGAGARPRPRTARTTGTPRARPGRSR